MRDVELFRQYTAQLRAERREQEARQTEIAAGALEGFIDVLDGQIEGGIVRIQSALDNVAGAEPAPGIHATLMHMLIEACWAAGKAATGLAAAERTLRMGGTARLWQAETHRLRAEFLASLGASSEDVDAELERSLHVARYQGAKLYEIRAATSLLRHRVRRGNGPGVSQARELLLAIFGELREEPDIHDVRQAASLLALS
jgi:ATP/maltotriose-dependent transcriptional regulator MalT